MAFMQKQVWQADYYAVETTCGTEIVPLDVCGEVESYEELRDYLEGTPDEEQEVEVQNGWLSRLSAPGYMDCTDTGAYETKEEALAALEDMYGDDDEEEEENRPVW